MLACLCLEIFLSWTPNQLFWLFCRVGGGLMAFYVNFRGIYVGLQRSQPNIRNKGKPLRQSDFAIV